MDALMAWIRFFFIPDLSYNRYGLLPNYEELQQTLQALREHAGETEARSRFFKALLSNFEQEADNWVEQLKGYTT